MGFLTSLFGGETGTSWWGVGFALVIVLVLIVVGLWALKLLFNASGTVARGRQRRLAVIDTLAIDGKRNLVLVRRDDVEHLLVLGGTHEVVVESGIDTSATNAGRESRPVARAVEPTQPAATTPSQNHGGDKSERRRTAAASRLGLTGLLRRYNDAAPVSEPVVDTPEQTPLDRLKNFGQDIERSASPTLRHTGLLRSVSNDDDHDENETAVEDPEISDTSPNDSVMNVDDEPDARAMASIEEGVASDHAGAEQSGDEDDEFVTDGDGEPHPDSERRH